MLALSTTTGTGEDSARTYEIQQAIARCDGFSSSFQLIRKVIALTHKSECTNEQLQRLIAADPGLTARILKTANSAFYGVSRQVRTLSTAITLIGHAKLRHMLQRLLVADLFRWFSHRQAAPEHLVRVSLAAGAAAHRIADDAVIGDPEEHMIAGLLHNAGEMFLWRDFSEDYEKAQSLARMMSMPEALEAIFSVTSAVAGKWLLQAWGFPALFVTAVEHWPNPFQPAFDHALVRSLSVLHAGVCLAEDWVRGQQSEEAAPHPISVQVLNELGLEPRAIFGIYENLGQQMAAAQEILQS